MSTASAEDSGILTLTPIAVEYGLVAVLFVGLYVWHRVVSAVVAAAFGGLPGDWGLVDNSLAFTIVFLAGLTAFAVAYVNARDIDVGLTVPSRVDLPLVAMALVAPAAFVGLTKLVGVATGVPYNELTMVSVAADPDLRLVAIVAGLGILVTVPTLVLVAQVLVQGGFRRVVGRDAAIGLTTLVAGVALLSETGGPTFVPNRGRLIAVVLFAAALGVAVYGRDALPDGGLRYLAYVPAGVLALLVVGSGIAELETVAGVLFVASHVAVFGVAAYTYDRTDSVVVPALAYLSLLVANRAVVVFLEAGMQSW